MRDGEKRRRRKKENPGWADDSYPSSPFHKLTILAALAAQLATAITREQHGPINEGTYAFFCSLPKRGPAWEAPSSVPHPPPLLLKNTYIFFCHYHPHHRHPCNNNVSHRMKEGGCSIEG